MSCRYCPAGVQDTVLGFTVDLSALPYLLRLFPRSSPSGRPRSVGPSWLRLRQLEKSCKQGFDASPVGDTGWIWRRCFGQAFWSERRAGVGSERRSFLARPSDRRLDRPLGLSLGFWADSGVTRRSQHRLLGRAFAGKQVHEGPRVYEPDKSPRAPG